MEWIFDPQAWIAFATLLALEIVLGIDKPKPVMLALVWPW